MQCLLPRPPAVPWEYRKNHSLPGYTSLCSLQCRYTVFSHSGRWLTSVLNLSCHRCTAHKDQAWTRPFLLPFPWNHSDQGSIHPSPADSHSYPYRWTYLLQFRHKSQQYQSIRSLDLWRLSHHLPTKIRCPSPSCRRRIYRTPALQKRSHFR